MAQPRFRSKAMDTRIWHYERDGGRIGPLSEAEVYEEIAGGNIGPETLVWHEGMDEWEEAQQHFQPQDQTARSVPVVERTQRAPRVDVGAEGSGGAAPPRGFKDAIEVCLAKYMDFTGRASRSEFWFFALFTLAVGFVASIFDAALFAPGSIGLIGLVASLALLIPGWAVGVRRLHDTNRSGMWYGVFLVLATGFSIYIQRAVRPILEDVLAGIETIDPADIQTLQMEAITRLAEVPFIGLSAVFLTVYGIVLLVFFCRKGTDGPNRYDGGGQP